jgi:branched-chain amino acid transport system permease protein
MMARLANWSWVCGAAAAIALAWLLPSAIGRYYTQMLALAGIFAIAGQGLNLLTGYTGQTSLGHA